MAGPLIEMLQGLRQRRMRRRSGWGGGGEPAMRGMINPLDSQDMTDRAQGVDISNAMPPARLETRMAEPVAESYVTSQLPRPESISTVAPQAEEAAPARGPFRTAAGSNANPQPMGGAQMRQYFPDQPGVCTGPNCQQQSPQQLPRETVISERVTHINGVPVGGQPAQPGAAAPADPFSAFQENYKAFSSDPKNANWMTVAKTSIDQANGYFRMSQSAATVGERQFYRKLANSWGMEAMNAMKASILQADAYQRQDLAKQQLNKNTLGGQATDMLEFLTQYNPEYSPEDRAAMFVGKQRALTGQKPYDTDEQMAADPAYSKAKGMAYAGEVAALVANNTASGRLPFGTEEERNTSGDAAWVRAVGYYGAMPFEEASKEIQTRFVPAYTRTLTAVNESRPEGQRISPADVQNAAQMAGLMLQSLIYHDQNPEWTQPVPAQEDTPPAKPPQAPAARPPVQAPIRGDL